MPSNYEPSDLVIPNIPFPYREDLPKKRMRRVAAIAIEKLFIAAENSGLELYAQSGYRSYDRQEEIFEINVKKHGERAANLFSARPGESEHQSGLAMDVTCPSISYQLIEEFADTDEGIWLQGNAANYGFIIRYPKGKEDITKYQYEPWHIRFVGKKVAVEIMSKGITLEEYLY